MGLLAQLRKLVPRVEVGTLTPPPETALVPETKASSGLFGQWMRERFGLSGDDATALSAEMPTITRENRDSTVWGGHGWTSAAIRAIIQNAASCPWVVQVNGKPRPDHPLAELLAQPNPLMSFTRLMESTLLCMELWGEGYWIIERSGGQPVELWPTPPTKMRLMQQERGLPKTYGYVQKDGKIQLYDAADIVWFHYPAPGSAIASSAPLDAVLSAVQSDLYAIRHNILFFKRGAHPQGALVTPPGYDLTDDQLAQIRSEFAQNYAGLRRFFSPLILSGGVDWKPMGGVPDAAWVNLREQNREEVLSVFGVPPAVVGVYKWANYANVKMQLRLFWQACIKPRLRSMAEDIDRQLIHGADKSADFEWQYADVDALQPDFLEVATAARELVNAGLFTPNQIRAQLWHMEPVEWGDVWWRDPNLLPTSGAMLPHPTTPPPAQQGPPPPKEEEEPSGPAPTEAAGKSLGLSGFFTKAEEEAGVHLVGERNQLREVETGVLHLRMSTWYDRMEALVLGKVLGNKSLEYGLSVKAPLVEVLVFSMREGYTVLDGLMTPELERIVTEVGQSALRECAVDRIFDIENPRARGLIRHRRFEFKTVAANHRQRCLDALAEGVGLGEGVEKLAERVKGWARQGRESYAMNLARTESGIAMNQAALEGYQQGDAKGKRWLSILDGRTRDHHRAAHGTVVPIEGSFRLGRYSCNGPGDPRLPAEEICQCRCTISPVFELGEQFSKPGAPARGPWLPSAPAQQAA